MSTYRVLVVDDNDDNRIILSRCVKRAGHTAVTAENGPAALERIASEAPDLVLLDWNMPDLPGIELLRAIREAHAPERLPIIMCTARNDSRDVQVALAAGANDFITKPIDITVAVARIDSHLRRLEATKSLEEINGELERAVAQRTRALLEAAPAPQRTDALEKILRMTHWLEVSKEASELGARRACAASIREAARVLAQTGT